MLMLRTIRAAAARKGGPQRIRLLQRPQYLSPRQGHQNFTTAVALLVRRTQMPARPTPPPETDIDESFLKGSGPGGQKINKTNSAVQLIHKPTGIVVKSQATRSREQNRKIARNLLATRLDDIAKGDQSRSAIVGNDKKKRADSAAKKSRRKYRKLEEERQNNQADAGDSQGQAKAQAPVLRPKGDEP